MSRKFYTEDNNNIPSIKYTNTVPTGYTLVTDVVKLKSLYIKLYRQRQIDGIEYFEDFKACLMMDVLNEVYTSTEAFDLETHIKVVHDQVVYGSWLTAQRFNTDLALSGIYTQDMKDEIQTYIDSYVVANY